MRMGYKLIPLRVSLLRSDELREGKCFNSEGNWFPERLEAYLIYVPH
jgi:hypothetical protein